jgi:hypothetical protein
MIAKVHPFDPRLHAMRLTEREAEERGITPTWRPRLRGWPS